MIAHMDSDSRISDDKRRAAGVGEMIVTMAHPVASMARAVATPAASFLSHKAFVVATSSATASACTFSRAALATTALAIRGGGATPEGFDLTRVRIRLEGLQTYGVMTALLMNAALRLFSSTPKKLGERKVDNYAKILFTATVGTSVVAGAYTTVVFSLLSLYSKSALGLGMDAAYVEFFAATASVRKMGFDCFILCLLSFNTSFVLSLFLNYEGKMRWWAGGVALFLVLLSIMSWSSIMVVASRLLFSK